jgi:MFS family permease
LSATGLLRVYASKSTRVFFSSLLSILVPQYLLAIGYSGYFVGIALVAILGGNVVSNLSLPFLEGWIGRKRALQAFSVMMVASGALLTAFSSTPTIIIALFLGNLSTTGTEAGPFQSVEAGILAELAGGRAVNAFGTYNLVGYGASALGALVAGTPGFLPGGLLVFRWLFLGFGLAGVLLFILYSGIGVTSFLLPSKRPALHSLGTQASSDITKLSLLFSVDAFGGSFVSQYVLTAWFLLRYTVSSGLLGLIFSATNLIAAVSVYTAARIATRLGNLRTMVYTHFISSIFLVAIPLAATLAGALSLLFLRQSLSQMDVPTRQALMSEMFQSDERVTAFALTNTARSVSSFFGGPINALLLSLGMLSGLLFVGGFSKMAYDVAIYSVYRKRFQ